MFQRSLAGAVAPTIERASGAAAAPPSLAAPRRGAAAGPAGGGRRRFSASLTAAALAAGLANGALLVLPAGEWLARWGEFLDAVLSLWLLAFVVLLPTLWVAEAAISLARRRTSPPAPASEPARESAGQDRGLSARAGSAPDPSQPSPARWRAGVWAVVLLAICTAGLFSHTGERNGFVASSRPASGVELWTTADGYTMLFDGVLAQGDGHFLLPMLRLFLGDAPPQPGEFDRRAGHVYLVSLLERLVGGYWAFAAVNLLSWWAAALAVWWLGRRRWPGTAAPWIAGLLTATGHGFVFMAAAPQAHAPAFAAFALVLALCDRLSIWQRRAGLAAWAKIGWATGAAGLIYLVHLPCLVFVWLYGIGRTRLRGPALATLVAAGLVLAWEVYATTLLGLNFAGGNNDLSAQAARNWLAVARRGPEGLVGQLHASSLRGLLGGAFFYPWWLLTLLGYAASSRDNRRWALAVILAGALPAIAFSTRFNLPRVAYFMYPAIYLLAARGIEVAAAAIGRWVPRSAQPRATSAALRHGTPRLAPPIIPLSTQGWVTALAVGLLAALANADLVGVQQLNLWFHYSQGTAW